MKKIWKKVKSFFINNIFEIIGANGLVDVKSSDDSDSTSIYNYKISLNRSISYIDQNKIGGNILFRTSVSSVHDTEALKIYGTGNIELMNSKILSSSQLEIKNSDDSAYQDLKAKNISGANVNTTGNYKIDNNSVLDKPTSSVDIIANSSTDYFRFIDKDGNYISRINAETGEYKTKNYSYVKEFTDPGLLLKVRNNSIGSNTINSKAIHSPLTSFNGKQYLAFADENLNMRIAQRTLYNPYFSDFYNFSHTITDDAHNTPNLGIDPNGYLHLAYDIHIDSLKYKKSNNPENINSWSDINTFTGTSEDKVTYPAFFNLSDNTLMVFHRNKEADGTNTWNLKKYDESTSSWADVHAPLIQYSDSDLSPYPGRPYVNNNGDIFLAWTVYDDASSERRDLYCIKSTDNGSTWTNLDGTSISLPITDEADTNNIDDGLSIPNTHAAYPLNPMVTEDQNNNPVVVYDDIENVGSDEDVFIYINYWTGSTWSKMRINQTNEKYINKDITDNSLYTGGMGVNIYPFTINNKVYIAAKNWPYSEEFVIYEQLKYPFESGNSSGWRRYCIGDGFNPLGCDPCIDPRDIKNNKVHFVFTSARYDSGTYDYLTPNDPIFIYEWNPPVNNYPRDHIYNKYGQVQVNTPTGLIPRRVELGIDGGTTTITDTTWTTLDTIGSHPIIFFMNGMEYDYTDVYVSAFMRTSSDSGDPFKIAITTLNGQEGASFSHDGSSFTSVQTRFIKINDPAGENIWVKVAKTNDTGDNITIDNKKIRLILAYKPNNQRANNYLIN